MARHDLKAFLLCKIVVSAAHSVADHDIEKAYLQKLTSNFRNPKYWPDYFRRIEKE